ncbi:putative protein RALF-like 32 [Cocos nucifera]|nr:putative protein RALF-like 32 [Cocos nucifera]
MENRSVGFMWRRCAAISFLLLLQLVAATATSGKEVMATHEGYGRGGSPVCNGSILECEEEVDWLLESLATKISPDVLKRGNQPCKNGPGDPHDCRPPKVGGGQRTCRKNFKCRGGGRGFSCFSSYRWTGLYLART